MKASGVVLGYSTVSLVLSLVPMISTAQDELDLLPMDLLDSVPVIEVPAEREWSTGQERIAVQWLSQLEREADGKAFGSQRKGNQSRQFHRLSLHYYSRQLWKPNWFTTFNVSGYIWSRDDEGYQLSNNSRIDWNEFYLTHTFQSDLYLDIGRINLRMGSAFGFNPTDYFKQNAVRDFTTLSARERRDHRLGSLMLRAEKQWSSAALTIALAPKITSSSSGGLASSEPYSMALNQTNDRWRLLLNWSRRGSQGLQTDLSYLRDNSDNSIGLSLSQTIAKRWILYGEWRGGDAPSALKMLNSISMNAESSENSSSGYQQAVIGFTYSGETRSTHRLEYHYNGAGLTNDDMRRWWDELEGNSHPGKSSQFWQIRGLSQSAGMPLQQQYLYWRGEWQDVTQGVDLNAMVIHNTDDASGLLQVGGLYQYDEDFSIEGFARRYYGKARSEYGSLPIRWNIGARFTLFF